MIKKLLECLSEKAAAHLSILVLLCGIGSGVYAQTAQVATIEGTIQTADDKALSFASVLLKNTSHGTMSDESGRFRFKALPGRYILVVTYAGYSATEKTIELQAGSTLDVGIIRIKAASNELREVVVADIQRNKFAQKQSTSAARMPLADLENAQVYSVITREIMQEQLAIDYNSAVTSVPGVVANNGINDSGNDFTLRGFSGQATFRNGLAIEPRTQSEIVNIERIDILKGPSGTLFGGAMTSYGGAVNTITKKPFESFRGEVSYTTGSWGLNRFTADINTPLNKDRTALIRINAAGHTQSSFQNAGFLKSTAFAASMSFKTSDKTVVRFDAEVYAPTKNLNALVRNSNILTVESMADLKTDHNRSFSSNDIGTRRTSVYAMAEVEHKISNNWTSRTSFQHGESGENNSVFLVLSYLNNDSVSRGIRPFDNYKLITDNLQQNFTGDFKIGKVRNRLVAGLDFFAHTLDYQYPVFLVNGRSNVFAPYDAVRLDDETPWVPIAKNTVDNLGRNSTISLRNQFFTLSVYASNVISITDRLHAMASLRVDRYENQKSLRNGVSEDDNYTQVQYSPKFGLVYEVIKHQLSLFGNYTNGFNNVQPSTNESGEVQTWKPEQANQWEGGLKLDVFNGKLSSTISYYDIKVSNMVRSLDDFTEIQDGNLYSKGVEVEIIANPFAGLNIIAGYGYNDNEYTLYDDSYQDKMNPWTPKTVANVWASYKIPAGRVKGLGAGAGVNYAGKAYMDISNTFYVPSYTIVSATAFYDQPKYRIGVKVNNLANEHYWNFYGQAQKPRELVATISYKF